MLLFSRRCTIFVTAVGRGKKGLLCSQCEQRPAASGGLSCWLPWLMESLGTDRAVHLVWLKRLVARPPCLFSFYSGRRITAKKAAKQAVKGLLKSSKGIRGESFTSTEQQTPVVHVGESCRGLKVGCPDSPPTLSEGLCFSFGKWQHSQSGRAQGKGTSWTLAPIYRLEAGVIKQPPSGIQMRNLVCNPRTQQMTMFASLWFSDLIKVAPYDPLWGSVSADGGSFIRLWPNVDTKQWRFSLSFWEDVDFQNGTQTLAHQTEQNWRNPC